ncbi:hypothetical protein F383_37186 [Gossypium arboreum]|uniref:Uncharacterized protein n=1 Tax=Gossypium arboreum TaxID=29729 RepID=A0A0B0MBP8_GOSAR|nr:hypothetical protein F383_37186 [Gossypium arboreum]
MDPHRKQHSLDFVTWACHTAVSLWKVITHGRVPVEPKFSPIQKRPILRSHRHSKAYLNT